MRAQEQAARDFAAQVQFETRPEVRKETRDFFHAQKEAIYASERQKQANDRRTRDEHNATFLRRALDTRLEIQSISGPGARKARMEVAEKRRQEADAVRQQLQSAQERKKQAEEHLEREMREKRHAMVHERFDPTDARLNVARVELRQSLKARSRAWTSQSPAKPKGAHL